MLTRLLALALFAASSFPSAAFAERENSAATGGSSLRGDSLIEIVADGIPYQELVMDAAGQDRSVPGLAITALDGASPVVPGGPACVSDSGQPWLENLLQKAMQWLSEPECAEIVAPDLHMLRKTDVVVREFRIYNHEAADAYLESFLKFNSRAFRNGYRRAGRYLPMIRKVFKEQGLPEALIYLPAVESNFNPRARSPVRAMGLWQFMVATARRFDLRVRYPWYDERLDPEKSTVAAARLLVYLHDRYGNWELALAAYNAGEGRVNRAIRRARAKGIQPHYWNLQLPPQTRAYVPAMLAMVKLYRSPLEYGFTDIEVEQPVKTEIVRLGRASSLAEVAHRLKMPLPELVRLNPAWRRGYIPGELGKSVMLRLPPGRKEKLLASLENEDLSSLPWLTHTVERKETLSKIARGYGITMSDIVAVNPIPNKHFLSIGQKLIIPLEPDARRPERWNREPAAAGGFRSTGLDPAKAHLHQVSEGETLSSISRRYRVSEQDLRRWNAGLQLPLRPSQPMLVYLPTPRREDALTMNAPSS